MCSLICRETMKEPARFIKPSRFMIALTTCLLYLCEVSLAKTDKIIEKTLFQATTQNFRYSEGAVLNLDGKNDLLMVVSVFSTGGHDNSPAQLLGWRSRDGGISWGTLLSSRRILATRM